MSSKRAFRTLPLLTAITMLVACDRPEEVAGECRPAFGGEICTWGTMTGSTLTEFGATLPMAIVTGAPMGGEMTFPPVPDAVIPLPPAVVSATGFDHLGFNWEAHGHPPALFMTPHFDFHFYRVGAGRVAGIDCSDTRKPAELPAAYSLPDIEIPGMGTLVGVCVPMMGMHSIPTAELDETTPFGASMLVGYYGQELLALEPMISQAKLAEGRSFPMTVPALPASQAAARWPTRFEAVYDAGTSSYRLVFSGLPAN